MRKLWVSLANSNSNSNSNSSPKENTNSHTNCSNGSLEHPVLIGNKIDWDDIGYVPVEFHPVIFGGSKDESVYDGDNAIGVQGLQGPAGAPWLQGKKAHIDSKDEMSCGECCVPAKGHSTIQHIMSGGGDENSESDNEEDYLNTHYPFKKSSELVKVDGLKNIFENIDTNGIDYTNFKKFTQEYKHMFKQCEMCLMFYKNNVSDGSNFGFQMVTPNYDGLNACLHCIYYINYLDKDIIDGVYGAPIYEYVAMCKDDHSPKLCMRETCLLCDALKLENEEKEDKYSESSDIQDDEIIIYI